MLIMDEMVKKSESGAAEAEGLPEPAAAVRDGAKPFGGLKDGLERAVAGGRVRTQAAARHAGPRMIRQRPQRITGTGWGHQRQMPRHRLGRLPKRRLVVRARPEGMRAI